MGKRSSVVSNEIQTFERKSRDFYGTIDPDAVKPLLPFISGSVYAEPCYGSGDLVNLLNAHSNAHCGWASDIEPGLCGPLEPSQVAYADATELDLDDIGNCHTIITNPPFSWPILQPILQHLPTLKPTWLLLPSDIAYNKRTAPYLKRCEAIVAVGRLYWMDNRKKGVDNYSWFKFVDFETTTVFHGRLQ